VPSSRAGAPSATGASEFPRRLLALTVFRTVTTTLSLAAIVLRLELTPALELSTADTLFLALVGLVYVLTLVHSLLLRRGDAGVVAAGLQVAGDILIASALVFLTGGAESPFTFVYSLAVIGAAILLGLKGALLAAAVSAVAYCVLLGAVHVGVLPSPLFARYIPLSRLVFLASINILALFLVAALSGFLTRRLSAREADLKRLGDLHQRIVNSMPSGVLTCAEDGTLTFINPVGAAILSVEREHVVGQHIERLLPGARQVRTGGGRRELAVHGAQGVRIVGLTVTALDERQAALLVVFQDLTELRRMEEELQRSDRLAAVGTLAAQLAHEVRNPLAAMRGSAQLLAQEPAADSSTQRLTDILVRESDRLSRLVDDFLRFARPPLRRASSVELDHLVVETVDMLKADPLARGVRIEVEVRPLQAMVDPAQLRQVLINLLRNAFQAAGQQGEVRVMLDGDEAYARIRVWDSAGGISQDILPRLFEPFFTTREGGTGLGLATAQAIVQAHGGSLQVRSNPEEGTEFIIGLPLSA
jgi:two-component system sensor histidine kinase PilS (NtrC family)